LKNDPLLLLSAPRGASGGRDERSKSQGRVARQPQRLALVLSSLADLKGAFRLA